MKQILFSAIFSLFIISGIRAQFDLVRDINIQSASSNGYFTNNSMAGMDGILYFAYKNETNGNEIWRSDGTQEGTFILKDIYPGAVSSNPRSFTVVGDQLFFVCFLPQYGYELWVSDGTTDGTRLVKDIDPYQGEATPEELTVFQGQLYFVQSSPGYGFELMRTDGTASGTVVVADINEESNSYPKHLTVVGDLLYFSAYDGHFGTIEFKGTELWKSDGTAEGTTLVKDINPDDDSHPEDFTNVGGVLYFTADDGQYGREIWKSDGTESGTVLVADLKPGPEESYVDKLIAFEDKLFFQAYGDLSQRHLWQTDGTESGTSAFYQAQISEWLASGDNLLFVNLVDEAGAELWKTTGTEESTSRVIDIIPGPVGAYPVNLFRFNGLTGFSADSEEAGKELWFSDGTESGTFLLKDINEGIADAVPHGFTTAGTTLFFVANDGIHGSELWKTTGTEPETELAADLSPAGSQSSSPAYARIAHDKLYFQATDGTHGLEPYVSDGTTQGTLLLRDIQDGSGPSNAKDFHPFEDKVIFTARNNTVGYELWETNGTAAGTIRISSMDNSSTDEILELQVFGSEIYFSGKDNTSGREPWISDGTQGGTTRLMDINSGPEGSEPYGFARINEQVIFFARDQAVGFDLWSTNGSGDGTSKLLDFNQPGNITPGEGLVFFTDNDLLWKTDGTLTGTSQVSDVSNVNNLILVGDELFFVGDHETFGVSLWKTDGTEAGTSFVSDVDDTSPYAFIENLFGADDLLYFSVDITSTGMELWRSDGTDEGTFLLRDIWAGSNGSFPSDFFQSGDSVLFLANDGTGKQLWTSNGSTEGTYQVASFNGEWIDLIGQFDGELFLTGTNQDNGTELWKFVLEDLKAPVVLTSDVEINLDENGTASITASMINDGSYDNVSAGSELSMSLDKELFTCSDLGPNSVTLTVTDENGNEGIATATVTVTDDLPPDVITQEVSIWVNDTGETTITPDQVDNGSSDNCLIEELVLDKSIFDINDLGENEIRLTATDQSGNSAFQLALVYVSQVTSIKELPENKILIHPNPATDVLNIRLNKYSGKIGSVDILSTGGRELKYRFTGKFDDVLTVDISEFSSGLYFLRIISNEEAAMFQVVVIK